MILKLTRHLPKQQNLELKERACKEWPNVSNASIEKIYIDESVFFVETKPRKITQRWNDLSLGQCTWKSKLYDDLRSIYERIVVIIDNTPSHNTARGANLNDGHDFLFQPAYSPFLIVGKAALKRQTAKIREQFFEIRSFTLYRLNDPSSGTTCWFCNRGNCLQHVQLTDWLS